MTWQNTPKTRVWGYKIYQDLALHEVGLPENTSGDIQNVMHKYGHMQVCYLDIESPLVRDTQDVTATLYLNDESTYDKHIIVLTNQDMEFSHTTLRFEGQLTLDIGEARYVHAPGSIKE